jgi:hypothetical protein
MSPVRLALSLSLLLPLSAFAASGCLIGVGDDEGDAGSDDALAMEEGTAADGTAGGECFAPPACDPLAPECGPDELCSESLGEFQCTPVPEGTELVGEGEPCGAASCDQGLVCVSYCAGGAGCCLPLCDLEQPQCPMDRACLSLFAAGSTQCYAHVGVCEGE